MGCLVEIGFSAREGVCGVECWIGGVEYAGYVCAGVGTEVQEGPEKGQGDGESAEPAVVFNFGGVCGD